MRKIIINKQQTKVGDFQIVKIYTTDYHGHKNCRDKFDSLQCSQQTKT